MKSVAQNAREKRCVVADAAQMLALSDRATEKVAKIELQRVVRHRPQLVDCAIDAPPVFDVERMRGTRDRTSAHACNERRFDAFEHERASNAQLNGQQRSAT